MLRHYCAVALRNLLRQRAHTAVAVAVLALGLVCFVAAYLFVSYLRGYDRHFANAERIQVIFQGMQGPAYGLSWPVYPATSALLGPQLELDVPELEAVARARTANQGFVTIDGESRFQSIRFVEPAFLDIFDFRVLEGDVRRALDEPHHAILTARAADALFGTRDVVGRTFTVTERLSADVTVAGVIEDLPPASHMGRGFMTGAFFDVLLSWQTGETVAPPLPFQSTWFNTSVFTYALLPSDGSLDERELDRRLMELVERHVPDQGIDVELDARHVSEFSTGLVQSQFQGLEGALWRVDIFTALLLFAGAILVIACLNFVNLATARSAGRAREIGVRKSMGATAGQIVRQDLVQTGAVTSLAVAVALGVIAAVQPAIDGLWGLAFAVPWAEPRFWLFMAAVIGIVTVLAGIYPALVLARLPPVLALRLGLARAGSKLLRTMLVGSQFAVASFLIVAVLVLFGQRDTLREALLGRFEDQYVILNPSLPGPGAPAFDVLAAELLRGPGIKGVTSGRYPWIFAGSRPQFRRTAEPSGEPIVVENPNVGYDYFAVLDIPLLAGRVFTRERADAVPQTPEEASGRTAPLRVVLDRDAASAFGWRNAADAVGQTIWGFTNGPAYAREVIGVVESVPLAVRDRGSNGAVYYLNTSMAFQPLIVRIAKGDPTAALAHLDAVLKKLEPDRPPRGRQFLDQAFQSSYWTFALIDRVIVALGAVAVTIAAFGLLGMASYMTARRVREIGLRKTQGATSAQILRLLLVDFSKPVLYANLLMWPVAYIAADRYLDSFGERIELTPAPFAAALLATVAVAWLAVGARAIRAAWIAPATALRHE